MRMPPPVVAWSTGGDYLESVGDVASKAAGTVAPHAAGAVTAARVPVSDTGVVP